MSPLQISGRRIFFFGALGGVLFGYDTGVISGAILFITSDFGLSPFMQGAVVAALLLGAMMGAAVAGPMSDRLGRRRLIMIAAVTFTIGALGAAAAPSAGALLAARFVIGLGVGSAALVVPLYLSEIAPTQIRGAISSLNQMMIVIGILAAFIVNAVLASSGDWRLMLGLAAVPSVILLIGMFFLPETPRFLVRTGEEGGCLRQIGDTKQRPSGGHRLRIRLRAAGERVLDLREECLEVPGAFRLHRKDHDARVLGEHQGWRGGGRSTADTALAGPGLTRRRGRRGFLSVRPAGAQQQDSHSKDNSAAARHGQPFRPFATGKKRNGRPAGASASRATHVVNSAYMPIAPPPTLVSGRAEMFAIESAIFLKSASASSRGHMSGV